MKLKPGLRLRSAVCDTEVVVVRTEPGDVDLRCGGAPMDASVERSGSPESAFSGGTVLGKRYEKDGGAVEVLCVHGGAGSLSLGNEALQVKGPRKLPASD